MDYLTERRNKKLGLLPEKEKKVYMIKHFSKKREKKQREYRKVVGELLNNNGKCQVKSPVCTGKAQGAHHIVKRSSKNLTDLKNLIPCCNACNLWIEEHSEEAKKKGFVISKFKQ